MMPAPPDAAALETLKANAESLYAPSATLPMTKHDLLALVAGCETLARVRENALRVAGLTAHEAEGVDTYELVSVIGNHMELAEQEIERRIALDAAREE